jgi:hypothetical protein
MRLSTVRPAGRFRRGGAGRLHLGVRDIID